MEAIILGKNLLKSTSETITIEEPKEVSSYNLYDLSWEEIESKGLEKYINKAVYLQKKKQSA